LEYAKLGNKGLPVSKLCFGTMTFGEGRRLFKAIGTVDQGGADELVETPIAGSRDFFDTADNYTSAILPAAHRRKLITSAGRNPCLSCRRSIPEALRCW
jgi:aryl-alcohol dehydrogenase-like predicted oxidoreductase